MDSEFSQTMPTPKEQGAEECIRRARKSFSRAEMNLGLYLVIAMGVQLLLGVILTLVTGGAEMTFNTQLLLSFGSMYLVAFPCYLLLSKGADRSAPKREKLSVGWFLLYLMMGEGLMIAGNIIGMIFTTVVALLTGVDLQNTTLSDTILGDSPYLMLFFAVCVGPIIEELLFRKILIDRVRKYGDGKAILLSGILFGLFHGNFTQFFYATGLGLLLAFVYVKTGNIRNTILMHVILNFVGSAVPMLLMQDLDLDALTQMVEQEDLAGLMAQMEQLLPFLLFVLFEYAVAITGVILLIVLFAKGTHFRVNPPEVQLPRKKGFSVSCLNVGMLVFMVVIVLDFILSAA